ncbi:MAG TPA: hypothetical protein VH475_11920, partial [Tepidisphaeraceae bacterium]
MKRSNFRSTAPLIGTCAALAVASAAGVADAGLLINVIAFSKNGSTAAITDPKLVQVAPGDTVIFRVSADVTGTDASLPECLQSLSGSFLTIGGGNIGNLTLTAAGITAPFGANGSSPGAQTDLDGDGDLDIGSNNPPDPAGFFAIRAAQLIGPRSTNSDGTTVFAPPNQPVPIP